jgi:putative oxidoreductase
MFRALLTAKPINLDLGLLIVRVGIGLSMLILHGWGKLMGGPDLWEKLGGQMRNLGIDFLPVMWGFMAMFAEVFGSALLILGLFFRPAALLLISTMIVAALRHLNLPAGADGAGWKGASHALELLAVYLCLLFTGPGRYRIALPVGGGNAK